jgi:hypothetical protein
MRTTYDVDGQYRGRDPAAAAQFDRFDRGPYGNRFFDAEHLYNFPHLSGNLAGTENSEVYVPGNYVRGSMTGPSSGDGVVTLFYRQLGNMRNVTLAAFHVADFGVQREGGRVRIGTTGGPGGGAGGKRNLHSHFELWKGNTGLLSPGRKRDAARVPFTSAFCK